LRLGTARQTPQRHQFIDHRRVRALLSGRYRDVDLDRPRQFGSWRPAKLSRTSITPADRRSMLARMIFTGAAPP